MQTMIIFMAPYTHCLQKLRWVTVMMIFDDIGNRKYYAVFVRKTAFMHRKVMIYVVTAPTKALIIVKW